VQISDFVTPTTPAGTALFLTWNGYHVFVISKREVLHGVESLRFAGVGGKRQNPQESLVDCALRESVEEIGAVVSSIDSAEQTYWLQADGSLEVVDFTDEAAAGRVQPRLIWEKRKHSSYGSMTNRDIPYYLVAFNASLSGQPRPLNEIAAILYLTDQHLSGMQQPFPLTLAMLLAAGAQVECQSGITLETDATLVPHGTAQFLVQQLTFYRSGRQPGRNNSVNL
jgi:8-oxo-dGTP pyrophosphatase MutT (NUDIX family)